MRKFFTLIGGLLMLYSHLFAQPGSISGIVSDNNGTPLTGVSVVARPSGSGTVTDNQGKFTLRPGASDRSLEISAVNFTTQTLSISGKTNFTVNLNSSTGNLAEVVVVGYGVQQKRTFTGSASKVDVKDFANLVSPSVDKQLAGRATGVQVTNSGGLVNSPARIRVRGVQSISQSNDPLIVVDGIPIISGNLAAATNSNTLADINPADIESLEVLKDGSATAIYGSRAAGGVILITTKKGTKGRSRVSYDGFLGFSSALKRFDLLDASQFKVIANEKLTNAGLAARAGINAAADTSNTDWQDDVMINNAPVHSHTLSFQGGGEKATYYLSLNYSDQKGIIISNYNKAYRARMNIEYEANRFIKFGNNMNLSRQEDGDQINGQNSLGGAIASSLRMLPNVSPYSSIHISGYNILHPASGGMSPGPNSQSVDDNFSNVAFTLRNNKYYSDKYRLINNAFAELSPFKGFKFRSQFGVDVLNDYSFQGLSPLHGDGYGTASGGTNGSLYNASQNFLRTVWTNYFNYNYTLGSHNVFLTGGHEVQKQTYKWFSSTGTNISDAFFIKENILSGVASIQTIGGNYDVTGFESFFGRLNYDYKNKYFLQGTIRRDGQSALAPGKKYGTFPGASVGWRPSQEAFWTNTPFLNKYLNEFKIKGSYAKVGNSLSGYPYLTTFGAAPYGNLSGIRPSSVGNPDLVWETSTKYDVGVEMGLFNNRFSVTADWFLNDVDNLVLDVPTPYSAGVPRSVIAQNIGSLQNRGIELALNGSILRNKDFNWDFNINYSKIKNKITSLYEVGGVPVEFIQNGDYNLIKVGEPINVIHGYNYAGVNTANGNPMYVKADGSLIQLNLTRGIPQTVGTYYGATSKNDGALGAQSSLAFADKVILGQGTPTWFGAFTNTFGYKGVQLEVMLRYSGGNKIMNYTRQEILSNMSFQNNGTEILNRWTAAGQVTDVPKLYFGQANNINTTVAANSRFVESGDFLRLQNLILSYSLPSAVLQKIAHGYFNSFRFYAQGQNLHVWTKYSGADPENITTTGVDNAISPQVRTVSIGLSVGF
ncbi:MAG: outer membrane protein nutrient binding [Segetibacter sp.]|nr:outer membrane protein nutrient binding [Segetibacter sp.]